MTLFITTISWSTCLAFLCPAVHSCNFMACNMTPQFHASRLISFLAFSAPLPDFCDLSSRSPMHYKDMHICIMPHEIGLFSLKKHVWPTVKIRLNLRVLARIWKQSETITLYVSRDELTCVFWDIKFDIFHLVFSPEPAKLRIQNTWNGNERAFRSKNLGTMWDWVIVVLLIKVTTQKRRVFSYLA